MAVVRPSTAGVGRDGRRGSQSWRMWAAALVAGAVPGLLLGVRDAPDVDLWLHLRIGDLLRAGERFGPQPDPLTALADRPYVPTQWLAQLLMSWVHDVGGIAAIQTVRLLLVVALGAVIATACRSLVGPTAALCGSALSMFAASASWGERPQLAAMVLLAIVTALWWRASELGTVPWACVPVVWVWTMVHGSWILGLAVQGVLLVGGLLDGCWSGRARLLAASVPGLGLGVALLTPLGISAVVEPFNVSSVARLTANEWQRPSAGNPLLLVLLVGCVIALLGLLRSSRRRWTRALTVVVAAGLGLWMVRTIAVGAVVLAPAVAVGMTGLLGRRRRAHTEAQRGETRVPAARASGEVAAWVLALVVALGLGALHLTRGIGEPPVSSTVSQTLSNLPPQAVLAVNGRAVGWTEWAHPDRRPLRDLRAEVYSLPVATAYEGFQEARPGWQDYATEHGVTAVLADRRRPLDAALAREPAWTAAAEDPDFRLWVLR